MPSFITPVFRVDRDSFGNTVAVSSAELAISVSTGATSFSYVNLPPEGDEPFGYAEVEENFLTGLRIDGIPVDDEVEFAVIDLGWNDGIPRSTRLAVFDRTNANGTQTDYLLYLGGDRLPDIFSASDFDAFSESLSVIANATSGEFSTATGFDLNNIPDATLNDDDFIEGDDGPNQIDGGVGNDTLLGFFGDDTLIGGAGDDDLNPGDSAPGGFDLVIPGAGNDVVTLSDVQTGYVEIDHSDLSDWILVELDDTTTSFSIDKGEDGLTFVEDYDNAMRADGFAITGTALNDEFYINKAAGYLGLRGLAGNDIFDLGDSGPDLLVRLDYRAGGVTRGVVANLGTGQIADDGFGSTDTVTFGAGFAATVELRGTNLSDNIIGSFRNERFILDGGNDTLDGGGGFDLMRFDRAGIGSVVVNLGTGTATGAVNGVAFSHQFNNIEAVRGSRNGNDLLIGDQNDNSLFARAGNDTMTGGAGRDQFDYGSGADVITDFDLDDDLLTFFLAGYTETTVTTALAAATDTANGAVVNFGGGNTLTFNGLTAAAVAGAAFATGSGGGVSPTGTLYEFDGFSSVYNFDPFTGEDSLQEFGPGTVGIALRNGVTGLSYSLRPDGEGGTFAAIDNIGDIVVTLDGEAVSSDNLDFELIEVTWLDDLGQTQTTVVASIEDVSRSQFVGGVFIDVTFDIVIAGAPLPITDLASFQLFEDRVISFGPVTTLGLLPGDDIVVADLPWDRTAAYFGVFGPVGEPGVIFGSEFDDQSGDAINGTAENDDIRALGGDDWIQASAGNDTIDGGFGSDVIFYDNEDLTGVFINDTFNAITGTFQGASVTLAGQRVLKSDGSTDTIQSIEAFHATNGDDLVFLGPDVAYVFDRAGDDLITADLFGNSVNFAAGSGNDTYNGTLGGSDVISYGDDGFDGAGPATQGVVVTMSLDGSTGTATDPWGDTDSFTSIERIVGTDFDDVMFGSNQDNRLIGEGGNDILNGFDGRDTLLGGAGDDALNAGDNDGSGDFLRPGTGNDTITFDESVDGYYEIYHDDLDAGITVTVNGNANTGVIDKGANGVTTLVDVINPIMAGANRGGLNILGSAQDDVFNVTAADGGWLSIAGGLGDDTFNIGESLGTLRLDYVPMQAGGINANLTTGIINAGSIGGVDTITGPGRVTELQATDSDDSIIGSAGDDSFILRQGNDTLDGGDGFDRLRYDRNGVSAILANLTTGTVVGGWFGEEFTHRISNIEYIRGSRDGNDQLIGNMGDNRLVAYAGDDTLDGGGGGNDTLEGGSGRDTFVLSGGVTTIVDFDPFNDRIQTNLPALNADQIEQALAAAAEDGSDVVVDFGGGSAVVFRNSFVDDIRAIVPSDGPFVPAPPAAPPAWTVGDPHLQTLDGVGYDFHAVGEFVLLRGTGPLTGRFEVQSRMAPVDGVPGVSVNEAVAINLDGRVVMIDAADANPLWVDGQSTILNDGGRLALDGHLIIRAGSTYTVYFAGLDGVLGDGDAQVIVDVRSGRLDIAVAASAEMAGAVEGLLGDGDGNAANDIARADGTVLQRPLAFEDLYGGYRDDWRVTTMADSLFVYDAGETLEGFYDPDAPGQTVGVDDFTPEQVDAAKGALADAGLQPGTLAYDNALLDFLLTGDPEFIESSANPVIQNEAATPVQKLDAGQGRVALSVTLTDAKGVAVADARVGFVADGQTSAFLAQAGATVGEYVVGLGAGSTGAVTAFKEVTTTDAQKINAADALAALRLGLGLNPSWGTADAFDFIQADVNRDGRVTANDALAILRIGLGLEAEAEAGWVFFEQGTTFAGVTRNAVPQLGDLDLDAIDADASVDLVGILVGNVENLF